MKPVEIAKLYAQRHWSPVPIPHMSKGPVLEGWQDLRLTETTVGVYFNGAAQNVGVILGSASGGLIDVDLDDELARYAAPYLMPKTGATFGRVGNPESHLLYVVTGQPKTKKFAADGMLVEVRGDGAQTVFPGSIHESGEPIEWVKDGEPGRVAYDDLLAAARELAATALVARHWVEGAHNDLCTRLSGAMLHAGWNLPKIERFIRAVCAAAEDEKLEKRLTCARRLADTYAEDGAVPHWPQAEEMLGTDAKHVRAWLGLKSDEPSISIEPIPAAYLDTPPRPLTFVVDQQLPECTVGGLIAESGAGKTSYALRAAMCVAMGRPVFGRNVTSGTVVYFALEDRAEPLWRRVHWIWTREVERMRREKRSQEEIDAVREQLGKNFYLVPAAGSEFHLITMDRQTVRQTVLVDRIIERIPAGTCLTVFDPYARAHGCEENSNSVGTATINVAERIARDAGCAVLLTHHVPKAAARDRHEDHYAARGASGLVDGARVVWRLMIADEKDCRDFSNLEPEAVARGDVCRLTVPKCNDFKKPPTLWLRRQGLDFEAWNPVSDAAEVGKRAVRNLFDWWLKRERRTFTLQAVTDLRAEALGIESRDDARRTLAALRDEGVLVESDRAGRSRWHALTFREGYEPEPDL